MEQVILIAAFLMFIYGIFSKLADNSPITAPMVFVIAGILLSPLGLGFFTLSIESDLVKILAEITLIFLLFTEASKIDLRTFFKEYKIPMRLLFTGLPLTMVLGFFVAFALFPSLDIWALGVMALILSPTDAALSLSVINSEQVPQLTREAIAVESGLNDGIALPPILACITALVATETANIEWAYWVKFILAQIIVGVLVGSFVGFVGGFLIIHSWKKHWINQEFVRLSSIALAVIAYALSIMLTGNGFIAAFFGGLFLGTQVKPLKDEIVEFGESEGEQFTLFVFLLFGLVIIPTSAPLWTWKALLYAFCSLTFIRMLPVFICLIGSRLSLPTVAFIGWFGPRGMASILYLLMFIAMAGEDRFKEVLSVVTLTVLLSIFAHGLSAVPFSYAYSRYVKKNRL